MMKIRTSFFFASILVFLLAIFSCASSDSSEESEEIVPVVEISDNANSVSDAEKNTSSENQEGILLPAIPKKSTYFEFSDPTIMENAEIGSPTAIKNVITKLRKANGKYTEEESVLFAVLETVASTVWPSENINFPILDSLPENVYAGIIDYVKKGIFDTNAGNSDFYTLVLPCVIVCTSTQTAFFPEAEENLLEALDKNDKSVLVHYLLGILYKKLGNQEQSFYHLERAYELDSTCFEINFEYAKALYEKKLFQKAFDIASSLKNPEDLNLELLELCAKSALAINKLDVAESYVGKLLQKEPDNPENILLRAEILFEKGEYLRVSSLLDAYSKTDKTALKYLLLRSQLQNVWNRNTTAAISTISEALTLYPDNHEVLLCAAELISESGSKINGKSAFELIEPLKQIDGENPKLLQIEIDEYIRQKQWKNAYEVSQKLIQIEPSENRIIKNILICIELGENQQAFFLADELYTNNPTSEEVQITYVKTLVANNKKTEAITLINSLLQKASSKMKSELYYQKSRLESSDDKKLSDLRSSLTANPRNEEALFALYELYFKKNDYRKAQYYLKQVIALNPSNQELLDLNSNLENYLY
ncbi:MAG: hypothetical protein J6A14_01315 [Spirochaetaceae bacterium]|nr:hypothetical protein [Spirochaetaceae bacterium]